jgi:hypothetical protein
VSGSELGMTRLQFNTPIPSVYAMGVTLWGIYFALRYRWILAFSLFGCACILQFLVGLLPAMLCTPLMFLCVFRERQWKTPLIALLVFGVGAAVVYLPMRLGGSTASVLLSDQEFVNLYGQILLPHHIVPSAWPLYDWMDALIFFTGGILISYRCQANVSLRLATVFIVGFVAFFLTLNYVFVEIWPWALIAKLQFGRMVPFAVLSILFPLVLLFDEQYRAGRYWVCGGLVAAPMAPYGGLLLALLAVFWTPLEHFQKKLTARDSVILGLFTFATIFAYAPSLERSVPLSFVWTIPLLLIVFFSEALRSESLRPSTQRIALCVTLALGASTAVYVEATGLVPEAWPRRIKLDNADHDQITDLAAKYRASSNPDALILIPPSFQHFRRYSERSVVVDFKGVPLADTGILEWKRRMEIVLGTAVTPDSYEFDNLFKLYFAQSPQQLLKIARLYHATHIMTHLEYQNTPLNVEMDDARHFHSTHPENAPTPLGKVIAQEQLWVIWEVPSETPTEIKP